MTDKKNESKTPETLRGMKDILPDEQTYWEYFRPRRPRLPRRIRLAV